MMTEHMHQAASPVVGIPAGLRPRAAARVIDGALLAAVGAALGAFVDFGYVWLVGQAIVVFAYFVLLDHYWGTTPGKRLLDLKVTDRAGDPPAFRHAAVREAFTVVGAVPYIGPLLALGAWTAIAVTIRSSPDNEGKHDQIAGGTRVVRA